MAVPFLSSISLNKNEVQDFKVFNYAGDVTPLTGTDIGYFWTNTTGGKTLRWWDGSAVRTILDSSSTTVIAADLSGGTAGSLPYQQGASDTTFLGIGTAGQVLKVNSGATAPEWTAQSNLSVGTATFLAGGTAGDIPVQSAAGTTGFLNIGANGRILTSNGSTPVWSATIPSSSVSGLAASATTDTTNAANITSGLLPLARLALATGQFYLGDASNNPVATAKTSIPLSGFGAAGADVAMGGFKITGLADPVDATDAANRKYVDEVAQGLDVKASCLVGTIANINLSAPGSSIDGISLSSSNRVLVKDQTDKKQNGIYVWNGAAVAMTRSLDADTVAKLVGAFTFVEQGTNADSGWVCQVDSGTIGSVDIEWVKFSQAGSYTAGNGMVLSGGVFHFAQDTNYTAGRIPFASGNTTIGFSSNLFWDNSNSRLGIGTATVDGKVHIYGDTYANSQLRIQRNGAVNGTFSIGIAGTNNTLYIQDEVNATARLIIDGSGRLGIGTASPSQMLDVNGNARFRFSSGTGGGFWLDGAVNANRYFFGTESSVNDNFRIYDSVAGTNRLTLDTSGNLGVGVSPSYRLHVVDNSTNVISRWSSSSLFGTGLDIVNTGTGGARYTLYSFAQSNGADYQGNFGIFHDSGNGLVVSSGGQARTTVGGTASVCAFSKVGDHNTGLYFPAADTLGLVTGGSDRVTIGSTGNVLIGSTFDPGYGRTTVSVYSATGGIFRASGTNTNALFCVAGTDDQLIVGTTTNHKVTFIANDTTRLTLKSTGQLNFTGLNSAPAGAVGDLYYNSTSNTLQYHNNSAFQQLSRKYTVALNDGSVTVAGNAYTITHNMGSKDITVSVRRTTDDVVVFADVSMPSTTTATVTFAAAITAANYVVTVIG